MEPVTLANLVLVAFLEAGKARLSGVTAPPQRRDQCGLNLDMGRFDREATAAEIEALAARVRALPAAPTQADLLDLFETTMLRTVDDRLRGLKARIAAARRT